MEKEVEKKERELFDLLTQNKRKRIKEAVENLGPEFSREAKLEAGKMLVKFLEKNVSLQELLKMSNRDVTTLYLLGSELYNSKKYEEALQVFSILQMIDMYNADVATSIGACHQQMGNYQQAASYYMMAAGFDEDDPVPFYYMYGCFLKQGLKMGALYLLKKAIERCRHDGKHEKMLKKAELEERVLEEELFDKEKLAKFNMELPLELGG